MQESVRVKSGGFCPFCPGREEETPPAIVTVRDESGASGGWLARVIPNKFPALRLSGEVSSRGDDFYESLEGVGAHEVVIESPEHVASLTELPPERVRLVLQLYRDRLTALQDDPRLVHGLVFKNKGAGAGASLVHLHSQLVAMPVVPGFVAEELTRSMEFWNERGRCLFCDLVERERAARERVVFETAGFLVFTPYASRFPFEISILPKRHNSHFERISEEGIEELGFVLKSALHKLATALGDPPYNYYIHSAPFRTGELSHYHWHLEIFPRTTRIAGFEWGSGCFINAMLPERAAAILRDAGEE